MISFIASFIPQYISDNDIFLDMDLFLFGENENGDFDDTDSGFYSSDELL